MAQKAEGALVRSAYFLQDYWSYCASVIGTLGLTFYNDFSSFFNISSPALGIASTSVFVIGTIFCYKKEKEYVVLKNENSNLQNDNENLRQVILKFGKDALTIWRFKLGEISKEFNFGPFERITLYKHESNLFISLGRYAEDPVYDKKGRGEYPENQGCIEVAYRQGKAIELSLPDPNINEDEYYSQMEKKWNIPKNIVKNLKMKSRSYAAFCITNKTGFNKLGIIVFESTKENAFEIEALETAIKGGMGDRLRSLMEVFQPLEPSILLAKERGL